jgi:hypothetical protein
MGVAGGLGFSRPDDVIESFLVPPCKEFFERNRAVVVLIKFSSGYFQFLVRELVAELVGERQQLCGVKLTTREEQREESKIGRSEGVERS